MEKMMGSSIFSENGKIMRNVVKQSINFFWKWKKSAEHQFLLSTLA
jgi:hypothetical protein